VEWPTPQDVTDIRSFVGLASFYRRYIYNFSDKANGLNELLKKDAQPVSEAFKDENSEAWRSFRALKEAITTAPVLILPDQRKAVSGEAPFVIQTDASGTAIGAVLMQDLDGNGLRPISFISRALNKHEQNYSTGERELLGLVYATKVWSYYIVGAHTVLQGDHKPLVALLTPSKELTRRQARWIDHLVQVGVPDMEYVPGKSIPVPDALSRRRDHPKYEPHEGILGKNADPDSVMDVWKMDLKPVPSYVVQGMASYIPRDEEIHLIHSLLQVHAEKGQFFKKRKMVAPAAQE
jgi:hypothetical protein